MGFFCRFRGEESKRQIASTVTEFSGMKCMLEATPPAVSRKRDVSVCSSFSRYSSISTNTTTTSSSNTSWFRRSSNSSRHRIARHDPDRRHNRGSSSTSGVKRPFCAGDRHSTESYSYGCDEVHVVSPTRFDGNENFENEKDCEDGFVKRRRGDDHFSVVSDDCSTTSCATQMSESVSKHAPRRCSELPIEWWERSEGCKDAKLAHMIRVDNIFECDRERLIMLTTLWKDDIVLEPNMFPCKYRTTLPMSKYVYIYCVRCSQMIRPVVLSITLSGALRTWVTTR
jgi:hypothetical protein